MKQEKEKTNWTTWYSGNSDYNFNNNKSLMEKLKEFLLSRPMKRAYRSATALLICAVIATINDNGYLLALQPILMAIDKYIRDNKNKF